MRTDRGTEYVNSRLGGFFKEKGVLHQTTTPYTLQQNGAAERLTRTIMERANAILADAGLPSKFWADAVETASYIRNRSPAATRASTTHELFYGRKPDVSGMRVFGADAHVMVPSELRRKRDRHSEAGMFIGYPDNTKGYNVWLKSGKLKVVTFAEASSSIST